MPSCGFPQCSGTVGLDDFSGDFDECPAEWRFRAEFETVPWKLAERRLVVRYYAKYAHFEHLLDTFDPKILGRGQVPVQNDFQAAFVEAAAGEGLKDRTGLVERQNVGRRDDDQLVDILQQHPVGRVEMAS